MEEHNAHRAGDWYRPGGMTGEELAAWYESADPEKRDARAAKKTRRTRITLIVLCVLVVAAAVISVVSSAKAFRSMSSSSARTPSVSIPDASEYQEDYRDYFAEYYTSSSEVLIESYRAEPGVSLSLYLADGARELTLQEIYRLVNPAVVGVTTYRNGDEYSWGTGVLFTSNGYLITNTHIIQGTDAAVVSLTTGEEFDALLVGEDEESDIAVLKIDGADLPYAVFGDSDGVVVGDSVAAIGNPLGELYAGTMTNGIISSIDRSVTNQGHKMTLLQTNAALNEGNSGGPLVNMYGQVIGITNMKIMSVYYSTVEGIGFAIPSRVVKQVADQLLENGVVAGEPTIGITAGPVSDEAIVVYGLPAGVYVTEVRNGSDAQAQGLLPGDIILKVNGISVSTVAEVNEIKGDHAVGDTLTLTVYRDGETFDMDIKLVDKTMID